MKTFSTMLTSLTVISLSACASLSQSPQDVLLGGIDEDKLKPEVTATAEGTSETANLGMPSLVAPHVVEAESQIRATFPDETCGQFNMNALAFAAVPSLPEGKQSVSTSILKTLIMGTVAGAASGGVASLGIGSAFLETMAVGTANQLVFNGTRPVVDKIFPDIGASVTSAEKATEIKTAAARLDCAEPSWVDTLSTAEAKALLAKFALETEAAEAAAEASVNLNTPDVPAVEATTAEVMLTPALEGLPVNCPAGTTAQDNGTCMLN